MDFDDTYFPDDDDIISTPQRPPDRNDRLIPMINVVFLLLTFFMIAGTFRASDSLKIQPPETTTSGKLNNSDLVLYIGKDGNVALGSEQIAISEALQRIEARLAQNKELGLQLKADKHTTVFIILPILKKLSDLGLKHIKLVAIRRGSGA